MLDFSNQKKKRTQKIDRKQMFQGLSIALVQLKPVNTSENLLNKIRLVNSENSKTYVSQRLLLNLSDNTEK